jgi:hypothetical protein
MSPAAIKNLAPPTAIKELENPGHALAVATWLLPVGVSASTSFGQAQLPVVGWFESVPRPDKLVADCQQCRAQE